MDDITRLIRAAHGWGIYMNDPHGRKYALEAEQRCNTLEDALRRQLAELRAELEAVEWVEDHKEKGLFYCPRCGGEMGMGHYDGCQLAAALARAEAPGSGERGKG